MNKAAAGIVCIAFAAMMGALVWAMPPMSCAWTVLAPHVASALVMLAFGPYLFVAAGCGGGTLAVLYAAHLAFVALLVRKVRAFGILGKGAKLARCATVASAAIVSAAGLWYETQEVERQEVISEKVADAPIRLAVVSDLHSCRYGEGQGQLVSAIDAEKPDAVLMAGDLFDDRLPDENTQTLVKALVTRYPCFYVSGNHEYWSERVEEMKAWMRNAGVTVLESGGATLTVKGTPIDICGVDDPTYMTDEWWERLLAKAASAANPRHLRILLSHRPERVAAYEKFGFDLILTGHAHGGQWRLPFTTLCGYSPDQHFFPKYATGRYELSNGTLMLVCRGLARESTPLPRFFNHPSLMIVDVLGRGNR